MNTDITKAFEQARTQLLYVAPFYALMLQKCRLNVTDRVGTAGVRVLPTGQIELAVSPTFFSGLTEQARIGLLQHEMLHLFMKHINRGKLLDKKVSNIAMDIAINQFIENKFLPPGALTPEQYKLPRNREFEFYYSELMQQEQEKQEQQKDQPGQEGSQQQGQEGDGQESQQESPQQEQEQEGQSQQSKDKQSQNGGQNKGGNDQPIDNHDWSEQEGSGESSDIQELALSQMLKESADEMKRRFAGKTPAHIEKLLNDVLLKKPKVNWKGELRKYFGRHVSQEKESTRTRPNRRMGFSAQGSKREYLPKVTVAFDQSASMGQDEINAAFSEIKALLKNQEDSTEIVYFDTAIAKKETLRRVTQLVPARHANGGTDFNCVIDHLAKARPDLCVIVTDGEAPKPNKSKTPILWVILKNKYSSGKYSFEGSKIFVEVE